MLVVVLLIAWIPAGDVELAPHATVIGSPLPVPAEYRTFGVAFTPLSAHPPPIGSTQGKMCSR